MSDRDLLAQSDSRCIVVLRLAAFCCLAGWTWAHYYWEGPYGILFWDEGVYRLVARFGISWDQFVGSGANDGIVQLVIRQVFWLYLACTILTLTVRRGARFQYALLVFGSGLLAMVAYAKYLASESQLPMLIEFGGQVLTPLLLVLALALGARHRVTVMAAVVAVIMTFAGHGAYAIGWWPTPGIYYGMVSKILHVDHETVVGILYTAGILDFAVCVGICFPFVRRLAALYATLWGLLTALARPMAGMDSSLHYWGADQFIHEAVLRAPHFLIPFYLFLLWRRPKDEVHDVGVGELAE